MIETIEWVACAERMPDDDQTVLMYVPGDEVCAGWHDGDDGWRWADGVPANSVTYWAALPDGPA